MQLNKTKSIFDIDIIIVLLMMIDVMFLVYIGVGQNAINLLITLIVVIRCFNYAIKYKEVRLQWIRIILAFVYLLIPTLITSEFYYLRININYLFPPLIIATYWGVIIYFKREKLVSFYKKLLWPLNLYFIINFVLLLSQAASSNIFYDNITGLFGNYGTHRLTAFVCFLVLLNVHYLKKEQKKCVKILCIIFILFIIISMFMFSAVNDNSAIYIILPLVVVLDYYHRNKIKSKTLLQALLLIIVFVVIFDVLMKNSEISNFLDRRLFTKIQGFKKFISTGTIEEERYAYIEYALKELNGYSIGVGIGKYRFQADPLLSSTSYALRNWGMGNMGSLIASGGLFFMFWYIILYARNLVIYKDKKTRFVISVILLMLFYYGQTASSIPMAICSMMMLSIFITSVDKECYKKQ